MGLLARGAIDVELDVPPNDPCFDGLGFDLEAPLEVSGRITEAGDGQYYFRATFDAQARMECRRCLRPVGVAESFEVNVLFSADDEMTDPSVYTIAENAAELDMSEMIREETILAFPGFALCKEDCVGLCQQCGANLNDGDCRCGPRLDPRWAALEQLKDTLTDR